MIEIGAFVSELCGIRQHDEAVCKIFRNKELFFVLSRKQNAEPFSIGLRTRTKVYGYVEYFTADYADQLILRIVDLEMKSS